MAKYSLEKRLNLAVITTHKWKSWGQRHIHTLSLCPNIYILMSIDFWGFIVGYSGGMVIASGLGGYPYPNSPGLYL